MFIPERGLTLGEMYLENMISASASSQLLDFFIPVGCRFVVDQVFGTKSLGDFELLI